jgi:hypothetical protein
MYYLGLTRKSIFFQKLRKVFNGTITTRLQRFFKGLFKVSVAGKVFTIPVKNENRGLCVYLGLSGDRFRQEKYQHAHQRQPHKLRTILNHSGMSVPHVTP